jgi:hypothetical protein
MDYEVSGVCRLIAGMAHSSHASAVEWVWAQKRHTKLRHLTESPLRATILPHPSQKKCPRAVDGPMQVGTRDRMKERKTVM